MIIPQNLGSVSPIIFSILTIAYLMLFELGNEKIKHALKPIIIVLVVIFFIIAVLNIIGVYSRLN